MDTLDDIIKKYVNSTIIHGKESEEGNYKLANKHYKLRSKFFEQIKGHGELGRQELIKLLSHENGHVRVGAAFHVLSFNPDLARNVLKKSVTEPKGVGFKAKMIIKEFEKGNLTI
ncbi:hypothetical protein VQL36_04790 [Chengkuizengella sp. SCS-71B]|uniref:hypothetical protein n=1 Tax=Chengkuizengella sp. SCS-71B TaxID=3115290 RepID=UPI0032C21C48